MTTRCSAFSTAPTTSLYLVCLQWNGCIWFVSGQQTSVFRLCTLQTTPLTTAAVCCGLQVLTRAPTMHIFNLLAAMMAADTSGTHSTAAVVVPQLWSAVLGILQHGAAAAKLSVVNPKP